MKIKNKYLLSLLVIFLVILTALFVTQDNLHLRIGNNSNSQNIPIDSSSLKNKIEEKIADEMPQIIKQIPPKYPINGLKNNLECTVYIRVYVDIHGKPIKHEIVKREGGIKEFEDSVVVSAMNSKFSPAKLKGEPVEAWVVIPYRFKLR